MDLTSRKSLHCTMERPAAEKSGRTMAQDMMQGRLHGSNDPFASLLDPEASAPSVLPELGGPAASDATGGDDDFFFAGTGDARSKSYFQQAEEAAKYSCDNLPNCTVKELKSFLTNSAVDWSEFIEKADFVAAAQRVAMAQASAFKDPPAEPGRDVFDGLNELSTHKTEEATVCAQGAVASAPLPLLNVSASGLSPRDVATPIAPPQKFISRLGAALPRILLEPHL